MFANARMYAINPAVAAAWRALLEWAATRAEVDFEVIDYPAPAPLPALWARPDAAGVFMCGYPLSQAQPQPRVLAAPVPSPRPYDGRPVYWTDSIVPIDSPITRLEETFGRKFAYTTEDSQSGYQAPRLLFARHAHGAALFSATVGPLVTPRRIVEAVVAGDADAGPLDSYVHDLLRLHEPALASRFIGSPRMIQPCWRLSAITCGSRCRARRSYARTRYLKTSFSAPTCWIRNSVWPSGESASNEKSPRSVKRLRRSSMGAP